MEEKEDVIFAIGTNYDDESSCWVYITDKLTWEQEKRQNDSSIDWAYDALADNEFSEVMENVFEPHEPMNEEEVILCVEQLGFERNLEFQTFVEEHQESLE